MKKFYVLGIAAVTALSMGVARPAWPAKLFVQQKAEKTADGKHRANAIKSLWRPGTEIISYWTGEEWEDIEKYESTYDASGNVLVEINSSMFPDEPFASKTLNEYNADGQVAVKTVMNAEDGVTFENSEKTERQYDSRLTSVITDNAVFFWNGGDWDIAGNTYQRHITRNADGNITRVVIAVFYNGIYDPTQQLDIEYGDDKQASKITSSYLTTDDGVEFYWVTGEEYTDIVWKQTDGQIVSTEALLTQANAIKSCKIIDEDGDETALTVDYTDNQGSYKAEMTAVFDGVLAKKTVEYTVVDAYGSYDLTESEAYGEGDEVETYKAVERYRVDAYGLELEIYASESENGAPAELMQWSKGRVDYDPEYGYPLEYVLSDYDFDAEESYDVYKVQYSNYIDAANGVEDIAVDNSSAPVELFNLQGVRVDAAGAAPGIYIRRQGTLTDKIVIR